MISSGMISSMGVAAMVPVARVLADEVPTEPPAELVAPGFGAFLPFFALALVVALLGWSLTRGVRRSERRNQERQAAQEQAGATEEPAGQSEDPAGQSEDPAGQNEKPAGQSEDAPGQSEGPPGEAENSGPQPERTA